MGDILTKYVPIDAANEFLTSGGSNKNGEWRQVGDYDNRQKIYKLLQKVNHAYHFTSSFVELLCMVHYF